MLKKTIKSLSRVPFKYNGRDKAGLDCYGFICYVYKQELEVDLPDLLSVNAVDLPKVVRAMDLERNKPIWLNVSQPIAFDVCVMKRMIESTAGGRFNLPVHVGMFIDEFTIAHFEETHGLLIEKLSAPCIKHRITGIYRYAGK